MQISQVFWASKGVNLNFSSSEHMLYPSEIYCTMGMIGNAMCRYVSLNSFTGIVLPKGRKQC